MTEKARMIPGGVLDEKIYILLILIYLLLWLELCFKDKIQGVSRYFGKNVEISAATSAGRCPIFSFWIQGWSVLAQAGPPRLFVR